MGIDFAEHIVAESALLRSCAVGRLGVPVPACGDWDMTALIEHVAYVFVERSACIHAGADRAAFEKVQPTLGLAAADPIASFDAALADLLADFRAHDDADPAISWAGLDNTVGFWKRRVAHEVLTHRIDAQMAIGAEVSPVDAALAADGIDEYVDTKLIHKSVTQNDAVREQLRALDGVVVRFEHGHGGRSVVVGADGVAPAPDDAAPRLTLTADPVRLNLWLWRRVDVGAVDAGGRADLAARFYRLAEFIGQ